MRDLIVTQNITLNGVIEMTEDWFSPVGAATGVDHSDREATIKEQREAADAFLVGRVTFEQMRGYWPQLTDDTTGKTDYLNAVHKFVASGTMHEPGWELTTVLRGPLLDDVRGLKAAQGRDIVITGSISVVHALITAGVVDEYRLFVYPVVIGLGRRLFPDATATTKLRVVESRPFHSGIVLLRYRTG